MERLVSVRPVLARSSASVLKDTLEKDWMDVVLSLLVRLTTDLVERRLSAKMLITRSPASVSLAL